MVTKTSVTKHIPIRSYKDDIEMSGAQISSIISYGNNEEGFAFLERMLIFPNFRMIPNNTHGSAKIVFDEMSKIIINGKKSSIVFKKVMINGLLNLIGNDKNGTIELTVKLFPSREKGAYCEHWCLQNITDKNINIEIPGYSAEKKLRGTTGYYIFEYNNEKSGKILEPGGFLSFDVIISGRKLLETKQEVDCIEELLKRQDFIREIFEEKLVLETGNTELDCEFNFTKLRTAESIFKTESGYLHSPGGGAYYAAVWANDQAEYVNPFFPFLGYETGNESAINSFNLYRPFMGSDMYRIPSSIIAGGLDIWEGAKDRGDAAMYLYGASRFLLAYGDKALCEEFFGSLIWCYEYCRKNLKNGVILSDADELENRFPAGEANLCTNSLAYGGAISAAAVARELGMYEKANELESFAAELGSNIEIYFGANVSGFDTYRYYDGNDILRAWICIPLTMGILDRSSQTVDALLSDKLWGSDGVLTAEGDKTFWDRATLYALRGIFNAGYPERAYEFLKYYTNKRLTGDRIPYPVEAYPEGNMRHLSGESGLYARVITEGMFGMTPAGLNKFELCPSIPDELKNIKLSNIRAFKNEFSIEIKNEKNYTVKIITAEGAIKELEIEKGKKAEIIVDNR